jgi:hypothetical protein
MKTLAIIAAFFVSFGVLAAGKPDPARRPTDKEKSEVKEFKAGFPKKPHRLSGERYAEPGAPTDYTKPDDKKHASR